MGERVKMIYKAHNYQKKAVQKLIENKKFGLFAQVGLGKTIMTLSTLEYLINSLEITRVLIVGPPKVTSHTWKSELNKWDHLSSLNISRLVGTPAQRIKALNKRADIYTISAQNLPWLVHHTIKTYKRNIFDAFVVDESSMFRNPSSMRFKAAKKLAPFSERVIILTGSPAPNKLTGLWSQVYLLDQGKRLGRTYTEFLNRYFVAASKNGHIVYKWELRPGAEQQIYDAISDICLSMKTSDYLDLPPRYDIYESCELTDPQRYKEFKKTEVLTLADDYELTPVSASAMYMKLLQFCNGAIYKPDGSYEVVCNSKLDALVESVEALEGDPVFIVYQFKSDYERIMERIPHAIKIDSDELIDKWNRGEIEVALTQIKSLSHGVNLQDGGNHIFHFGVGNDAESYEQVVGRIDRQGVKKSVINKHFITKDSIEDEVLKNTDEKLTLQERLMAALKRHLS